MNPKFSPEFLDWIKDDNNLKLSTSAIALFGVEIGFSTYEDAGNELFVIVLN